MLYHNITMTDSILCIHIKMTIISGMYFMKPRSSWLTDLGNFCTRPGHPRKSELENGPVEIVDDYPLIAW